MKIEKNPRTDVDVNMLREVFPDILPDGREITHAQVEAVLHERRASSRYRRVTNKWRKQLLQERGVWLDGQVANGRGFVALSPDEMVRYGNRKVRQAGRQFKRAIQVASVPDDAQLSDGVRRYRALLMVAVEKMARENKSALREVTKALSPLKQLPRTKAS